MAPARACPERATGADLASKTVAMTRRLCATFVSLASMACVTVRSASVAEEPTEPIQVAPTARRAASHHVIASPRGDIHVFTPEGYDPRTAGVLLYVHGYYTDVDGACRRHRLAEQFESSGRNALFVVPEAPRSGAERVHWGDLDALLATVEASGTVVPAGPRVALAHSGGFRTVEAWLDGGRLDTIVLLDALYGAEPSLGRWLDDEGNHPWSLVLVGHDTSRRVERFARGYDDTVVLHGIPPKSAPPERGDDRLVVVRSETGHMELVTQGRSIPALLLLTPLGLRRVTEGEP